MADSDESLWKDILVWLLIVKPLLILGVVAFLIFLGFSSLMGLFAWLMHFR